MKTKSKKKIGKLVLQQNLYGYLFILPAFLIIAVFSIYPILNGLLLSFTNWDGLHEYDFIQFDNYTRMFSDAEFGVALFNTLVFVLGTVPMIIILSLLFAHFLNRPMIGKKLFRSIYFLPTITSGVAIAMIWKWIFNTNTGLINSFLFMLGMEPIEWLASSKYAMVSVIVMSIWKSLGTNIIIMLAALQSVPSSLYEASSMDTTSGYKKFIKITIPMISPSIFLIAIMSTISAFQVFEQVMTLTKGGPGNATLVVVLYIYNQAFENFNMGYASTLAYALFFIILLVTLIQWIAKKHWVYSEVD